MSNESAAQGHHDGRDKEHFPPSPDTGVSDSALLEDALSEAIDAHSAGRLAAPFGLDEIALARARRRALRADIKRLIEHLQNNPHSDNP
jgi:hypothetical protein